MSAPEPPGVGDVAGLAVATSVGRTAEGRAWLASLPQLIEALARDWELDLGAPWSHGQGAWTAPARTADGDEVVLKLGWPHPEAAGEAAALRHWDGHGAVQLLRADPSRWALLLRRCRPGTALGDDAAGAEIGLARGCAVLRRLWEVPPPDPPRSDDEVPHLAEVAAGWASLGEERLARTDHRYDVELARHGLDLLRTLPADGGAVVLLHGDFNPGNVLCDEVDGWLAIDPKPMLGDPAYDPWPLLTQLEDPFASADLASGLTHRYTAAADLLDQPRERLAAWSVARGVEKALWEDAHGDRDGAAVTFAQVRVLVDLLT